MIAGAGKVPEALSIGTLAASTGLLSSLPNGTNALTLVPEIATPGAFEEVRSANASFGPPAGISAMACPIPAAALGKVAFSAGATAVVRFTSPIAISMP